MTARPSRGPRWLPVAGWLALALALTLVGLIEAGWTPLLDLDLEVARWAHRSAERHTWLVQAADAVSAILGPASVRAAVAVVLVVLLVRAARHGVAGLLARSPAVVFSALAVLGGTVVAPTVKALVGRGRPPDSLRLGSAQGSSYPSGHAVAIGIAAMTAVLLTWHLSRRIRAAVASVAVLISGAVCASRVVLGVHYLSDVVGGLAWAVAWCAGSWWVARRFGRELPELLD